MKVQKQRIRMYHVVGIGVDIERISRFRFNQRRRKTFLGKIYTPKELDYCFSRKNFAAHLAARFAGKEAVYKAMSGMKTKLIPYNAIEINHRESGAPEVKFLDKRPDNVKAFLSLSHSADDAIAFAVVLKKE